MSIVKDAKFCPECGAECSGENDKLRKRSDMGSDAASIIAAVNQNTNLKFIELKAEVQTIKSDVVSLKSEMVQSNARIDQTQTRVTSVEETLKELRAVIEEVKSTKPVVTSTPVSTNGGFQPKLVFVRGFAPYGCAASDKLTRSEYAKESNELHLMLPEPLRSSVRIADPFPLSFQVAFRVMGGRDECEVVRDHLANGIAKKSFKIKGNDLKVSIEVSPERRTAFSKLHCALERVSAVVSADKIEVCKRTFTIMELPDFNVIARIPKGATEVQWDAEACLRLGVSTDRV